MLHDLDLIGFSFLKTFFNISGRANRFVCGLQFLGKCLVHKFFTRSCVEGNSQGCTKFDKLFSISPIWTYGLVCGLLHSVYGVNKKCMAQFLAELSLRGRTGGTKLKKKHPKRIWNVNSGYFYEGTPIKSGPGYMADFD